jgi:hypothetical protein
MKKKLVNEKASDAHTEAHTRFFHGLIDSDQHTSTE